MPLFYPVVSQGQNHVSGQHGLFTCSSNTNLTCSVSDEENNENRKAFVLLFCYKFWSKVKLISALGLLKDRVARFSKTFFLRVSGGAGKLRFQNRQKKDKTVLLLIRTIFCYIFSFSYSHFLSYWPLNLTVEKMKLALCQSKHGNLKSNCFVLLSIFYETAFLRGGIIQSNHLIVSNMTCKFTSVFLYRCIKICKFSC